MDLLVYGYASPARVQIEFAGVKKEQRNRCDVDKSPVFLQPYQIHNFNRGTGMPI
jgi:hypothetical protein